MLSCVLLDNESTVNILVRLGEDSFYSPGHKIIFRIMKRLLDENTAVDFVTAVSALDKSGMLESVGGVEYMGVLNGLLPSSANFKSYVQELEDLRLIRQIIESANKIIEEAHTVTDSAKALQFAEGTIFNIAKSEEKREMTPLAHELPGVLDMFDEIQRDPASIKGLKSGFWGLDKLTNGFQKSDLIIIAARPSVGKTSLALNMVLNAALKYNAKCAVFSLEMSKKSLAIRALCAAARVSMEKALKGNMSKEEWKRILEANRALTKANIYVDDSSTITPAEISRKCMRLKREAGLDLVMIDYLGLMGGSGKRESRQVEVADNSRMIKIMAKELEVPVLLLSQLNRSVESRKGEEARPVLSDLRESGAIEQDADIVMFIHKEKTVEEESTNKEVELVVAKHRNGPLGIVRLGWVGEHTSFVNRLADQESQDARDKIAEVSVQAGPEGTVDARVSKKNKEKTKGELEPKPLENSGLLDIF